eukprot:jgi/Chrpa1/10579/Chrysochromulina_OHIO_Genome00009250-RA
MGSGIVHGVGPPLPPARAGYRMTTAAEELYCFEFDTYVCSGFDDTSKATDSRKMKEQRGSESEESKLGMPESRPLGAEL